MNDMAPKRTEWSDGVAQAHGRALPAVAALVGMALVHGVIGVVSVARSGALGALASVALPVGQVAAMVQPLLHLTTAVLFLLWLAKSVNVARSFQPSPPLSWTASEACWGFFIPLLNLVRPYQVIRDLHDALAPDGVPEPAPRPRADGAGGYRHVAMEKAPPPRHLPAAWIGAWWGFYLAGGVGAWLTALFLPAALRGLLMNGVEVASATLAVLAVRAIDGRLAERNRRLQHASDEELTAWGIER